MNTKAKITGALLLAVPLVASLLMVGCSDERAVSPDTSPPTAETAGKLTISSRRAGGYGNPRIPQQGAIYAPYLSPGQLGFRRLGAVDTRTGDVREVITYFGAGFDFPADPVLVASAAFDVDGTLYTLINTVRIPPTNPTPTFSQLAIIDIRTDEITRIGDPTPLNLVAMEIDACGQIYAAGFSTSNGVLVGDTHLYTIDKETGTATDIGDTGIETIMDLAFDSRGNLYATVANNLYTLDPETGQVLSDVEINGVPIQRITGALCGEAPDCDWQSEVMTLAFDKHDVLYAMPQVGFHRTLPELDGKPHGAPLLEIDPDTGDATLITWTGEPKFHGGDIPPAEVTVCHQQGLVEVSLAALTAHLNHGDTIAGTDCGCDVAE